jgi:hypothetical protein
MGLCKMVQDTGKSEMVRRRSRRRRRRIFVVPGPERLKRLVSKKPKN